MQRGVKTKRISSLKPKPRKKFITVQFLGGAGTVTGSKFLIAVNGKNILVDCGLFQGLKKLRELNWSPLEINPQKIDLVLLTHGHLDHDGYLPVLVKNGFSGQIWGTSPTLQVAEIILRDSAKIQEEEAAEANLKGYSKHHPPKPLYTLNEAEKSIRLFTPKPLSEWIFIDKNISCRFRYNSHIIGATFIELKVGDKILVFSGDVGRTNDPLLFDPEKPEQADILFIESTYGNRLHPDFAEEKLAALINQAIRKNGPIIIPGFAVERTQMMMHLFWKLRKKNLIPYIPVYTDSPMGSSAWNVFHRNMSWHKLSADDCAAMTASVRQLNTVEESNQVMSIPGAKIIIAGSGMVSGGRVLNWMQKFISDPSATIILVGFQAEGTRGRQLLEGAHEIKIKGKYYPVKAAIAGIEGFSSHADQAGLLDWVGKIAPKPEKVFIIHGEFGAADALRVKLKTELGWDPEIPDLYQKISIGL